MDSESPTEPEPDKPRPASFETRRQLAHQVEKGRRTTFWPPDGDEPIVGYLAGWDPSEPGGACNFFVLEPTDDGVVQHMIPQEGTRLRLHREATFEDEKHFIDMERIVRGFRFYVVQRVLGRGSGQARETARMGQSRS